jgi:hypothetical protein
MKELSENPTAIDLIIAGEEELHREEKVRRTREEIKELLKAKEEEISEEIILRLINQQGCHRSNLKVDTTILLRKAIVRITNWNYSVEYRENDLLISEREDILDRIELSEMNEVFDIIKEVITKEGLQ